jgi:hypothetical protein
MSWHVSEEDLRAYALGELEAPALWSADAHLTSCAPCRGVLAEVGDPVALDAGWDRLDAELDAPRTGLLEGLLVRAGVAGHTARLLAATPVLRRSWLGAVVAVLLLSVAAGHSVRSGEFPTLFLALAPLLPLAGVALSYGPALDPTYEMAVVAPMHGFRLLMIRTVAVLDRDRAHADAPARAGARAVPGGRGMGRAAADGRRAAGRGGHAARAVHRGRAGRGGDGRRARRRAALPAS